MEWCFYKKGSGALHDVQEDIDENSINPATGKPYGDEKNWTENYRFLQTWEILKKSENENVLKYLATNYPKDLINAIKNL